MRSIWNGSIGFGLVNIPVKLYSAVQNSNLDLDMLDGRDHSKIKFQRINSRTQKEVPYEKIVKGYFLKDRYIVLEDKDFEEAAPEKNKIIELENFIDMTAINPIYYETSYYSEPSKQGAKAYQLLIKALTKSKKVGLGRFVLRSTENLCILHPLDNVIVVTKIRFQQEVRSLKDIKSVENTPISKKEIDVGMALIKQYSSEFDISSYKDTYSDELLKIIKAKAKGKQTIVKKLKPNTPVSNDLFQQLQESLSQVKKKA